MVGHGKRGLHHAAAFKKNPRFELAGLADPDPAQLAKAAAELGGQRDLGRRRRPWRREVKPDVFCFCTPPHVRLPLIQIGIESGAKLIAYEKPIALSTNEAHRDPGRRRRRRASRRWSATSTATASTTARSRRSSPAAPSAACTRSTATAVGWMTHMITHLVD